jgi:pSer/pThr/pTyr-binding forkhead associated (FHA) protein
MVELLTTPSSGTFDRGTTLAGRDTGAPVAASPTVRPIVKVQTTFPSMITVGRTRTNDIVLIDREVSKFHAYFREVRGAYEVSDVGSVNGTYVGDQLLLAKGPPHPVHFGDRVAFGHLEFRFLDPGTTWDELRNR